MDRRIDNKKNTLLLGLPFHRVISILIYLTFFATVWTGHNDFHNHLYVKNCANNEDFCPENFEKQMVFFTI